MAKMKGFPELLPEQELVQQHVVALVRHQFELHGFTPLLTRSIEHVDDLLSKGETDKEIYAVRRLQLGADEGGDDQLGLHFDLTVPFARWVAENRGKLSFPFRRYQIQPAWRGERPQLGRFREFLQADADIVAEGTLDVRHDADLVLLLHRVMDRLPVPTVKLLVNNRKLLQGFYEGLGVADTTAVLRAIDKLNKVGADGVLSLLQEEGLTADQAAACIRLGEIEAQTDDELDQLDEFGIDHPVFKEGVLELRQVLRHVNRHAPRGRVVGALHIARGFDYYTGTVVEGVLEGHDELGSVCSGGRYDRLVAGGSGTPLPGVGVSVGITRLLAYCFHLGLLEQPRKTPARVLVIVHADDQRAASDAVADALRARDIACVTSDSTAAYGKQIRAAERLGIRYVWFPPTDGGGGHEVKDIVTGDQASADPSSWQVPADPDDILT